MILSAGAKFWTPHKFSIAVIYALISLLRGILYALRIRWERRKIKSNLRVSPRTYAASIWFPRDRFG